MMNILLDENRPKPLTRIFEAILPPQLRNKD